MFNKEDMAEEVWALADKSLEELAKLEENIQLARSLKEDMKVDDIPKGDVEQLKAAWKLADHVTETRVTMEFVITTKREGKDFVFSSVTSPKWATEIDAEAYSKWWDFPKETYDAISQAEADLNKDMARANKLSREFQDKYDVPWYKGLD